MFSRREDNAVVFVCVLVGKGKEYFSQYLKSFCRYTASVLKVLVFRQTTVLDKKLPFVGDAALSSRSVLWLNLTSYSDSNRANF